MLNNWSKKKNNYNYNKNNNKMILKIINNKFNNYKKRIKNIKKYFIKNIFELF